MADFQLSEIFSQISLFKGHATAFTEDITG